MRSTKPKPDSPAFSVNDFRKKVISLRRPSENAAGWKACETDRVFKKIELIRSEFMKDGRPKLFYGLVVGIAKKNNLLACIFVDGECFLDFKASDLQVYTKVEGDDGNADEYLKKLKNAFKQVRRNGNGLTRAEDAQAFTVFDEPEQIEVPLDGALEDATAQVPNKAASEDFEVEPAQVEVPTDGALEDATAQVPNKAASEDFEGKVSNKRKKTKQYFYTEDKDDLPEGSERSEDTDLVEGLLALNEPKTCCAEDSSEKRPDMALKGKKIVYAFDESVWHGTITKVNNCTKAHDQNWLLVQWMDSDNKVVSGDLWHAKTA
ncbi:hypothetical protein CYMTET_48692 [Cymbomonas tetramitiformis]|uniref:Uncharacterized protein n=1 Tax=Cymbomonas tetramitiformis TaxID=36881 RepID=A0AAE0BRR4_9CHLO|nr:hypothetical protein CYMTET_48692 [Cymbomonas tetramitiformis]